MVCEWECQGGVSQRDEEHLGRQMPPPASTHEVVYIQCVLDLDVRIRGVEDHRTSEEENKRGKQ